MRVELPALRPHAARRSRCVRQRSQAHSDVVTGVQGPAKAMRILCGTLDLAGAGGIAAAVVFISAFHWLIDDRLDGLWLHGFSLALIGAVACFGLSRILELSALACTAVAKERTAKSRSNSAESLDASVPTRAETAPPAPDHSTVTHIMAHRGPTASRSGTPTKPLPM